MNCLGYLSDVATIATAFVAVWFWWATRESKHRRRTALEGHIVHKAETETSTANDARTLTLEDLMAAEGMSADDVRELLSTSRRVEAFQGADEKARYRVRKSN
jgi:hypothetical protein